MGYNHDPSNGRILYRKARSFAKGTLEGFLGTFILPTMARKDISNEIYKGNYNGAGCISGSLSNLAGHAVIFNYLPNEKAIWAFIPIAATNFLSGAYEFGKWAIKRMKEKGDCSL